MKIRNRWLRPALCLQTALALLSFHPSAIADNTTNEFLYTGGNQNTTFQLESDQYQTVYQTEQVPSTCTQQVQNGYDTQCTPTTRRQCQDVSVPQCTTVNQQQCTPTTRRQCSTVNHQQCQNTTRRQCTNTTRRQCSTVNQRQCTGGGTQCENVPDQVCHAGPNGQQVCQTTTRRQCHDVPQTCTNVPVQQCQDVPDQVCQDVPDQICTNVPDTVCVDVPDQVCQNVPQQQCTTVTQTQCQDVPDQVCQQVPHYDTQTYACTIPQQVAVGQQLVMQTLGNVTVTYGALPQGITPNEDMVAQLGNQDVSLSVKQASGQLVIFANKTENASSVDSNHQILTTEYDLTFANPSDIAAPVNAGIADVALTSTTLTFTVGQVTIQGFLAVTLNLTEDSNGATILNSAQVPLTNIAFQDTGTGRTQLTIQLADLGVQGPISIDSYQLGISVGLQTQGINGVLDASALANVQPATYAQDVPVNN
jgi:hypothetical protein